MPGDDFGERTEQPTERRRLEARRKGNVARSTDLNAAAHMLTAALILWGLGLPLIRSLGELMAGSFEPAAALRLDPTFVVRRFHDLAVFLGTTVLPWLLLMMVVALAANVLQIGILVSPEAVQPKLSRLSPWQGVKRIVSMQAVVKLLISLGKLMLFVLVAGWFLSARMPRLLTLVEAPPAAVLLEITQAVVALSFRLAAALTVLAVLDFGFQRWKHERDLRMTKQEVRDELKEMEGDPQIRQRRRDAHRKLAQAREMARVPEADVVITNPTHIAVAVKYDPETMDAPTVLAKGMGAIAERIRMLAAEHGVPIIERKELARALYRDVPVGRPIPLEMYAVFVEIMAYVYRLQNRSLPELGENG